MQMLQNKMRICFYLFDGAMVPLLDPNKPDEREKLLDYSLFLCDRKHKDEWERKVTKVAYFPYFLNKLNLSLT